MLQLQKTCFQCQQFLFLFVEMGILQGKRVAHKHLRALFDGDVGENNSEFALMDGVFLRLLVARLAIADVCSCNPARHHGLFHGSFCQQLDKDARFHQFLSIGRVFVQFAELFIDLRPL